MRNVHMCGNSDLTLAECSECDGLEARLTDLEEEVDECCTSVKETLSEHATELVNLNDDLNALVAEVRSLTGLQVVQVEELPETGQANTIYLVPNGQANDMYMYLEDEWVLVGDTSVDLSGYVKTTDLLDAIYPVGSIYMSVNSVSPQILFGGTWTQLENKFLLGAGTEYTAGSTGGSAYIQSHTHTHNFTTGQGGEQQITGGAHSHGVNGAANRYFLISPDTTNADSASGLSGSGYFYPRSSTSGWEHDHTTASATHTHYIPSHTHPVLGTVGAPNNVTTGATSGTSVKGNMPPYLAVYMWKRTA